MRIREFKFRVNFVYPESKTIKLVGIHGIGKSAIVKEVSEERRLRLKLETKDYGWYDLRLSQNDVGDLKGFPFQVGGRTYFAPPAWFPIHPEDKEKLTALLKVAGIEYIGFNDQLHGDLFLDEVNRGSNEASQCVFQLVNDRRMGDWRIPDGWRIFAAENPASGGYQVKVSDPAAHDRYITVNLEPDLEDFMLWAEKKSVIMGKERENIHPVIRKYINNFVNDLDPTPEQIEAALAAGGKKLPSRRSWETLSLSIYRMEDNYEAKLLDYEWTDRKHKAELIETVNTIVGKDVATRFADFVEKNYKVLTAEMVLDKWTDEVKGMVLDGNPLELTSLVNNLTKLVMTQERTDKGVSKKQKENISKLIFALDEGGKREIISALWMATRSPDIAEKFSKGACKTYLAIFKDDKEVQALINSLYQSGSIKA